MNLAEIHNALSNSIKSLIKNDRYLLEQDSSERSIAFRLGLYMNIEFGDFDIDCEYNRNAATENNKKLIFCLKQKLVELNLIRDSEATIDSIIERALKELK